MLNETSTNNTAAVDMQDQLIMQDSARQDPPLLKIPSNRLEICRFSIQHELNAIKSAPNSYEPTKLPFRGALALLHTCHTLRVESIDAMEPLAQASRSVLEDEWLDSDVSVMIESHRRRRRNTEQTETPFERLNTSISHMGKVCELLALAGRGDEKTSVN